MATSILVIGYGHTTRNPSKVPFLFTFLSNHRYLSVARPCVVHSLYEQLYFESTAVRGNSFSKNLLSDSWNSLDIAAAL
jgi:hypothetical protein